MPKKLGIAYIVAIAMIAGIIAFSGVSIAAPPPPPGPPDLPTPTPAPAPAPSNSGGSSSSYTAAPSFQPYTVDLHSSDGTVIGKFTGVDYFTVNLKAARSYSADGQNRTIEIEADLNNIPTGATLDISPGSEGDIPDGMDNVILLSSATLTPSSSGWPVKSGVTVRFTIPAAGLPTNPDAKYYLVHYDGSSYHIIKASVASSNGVATVEAVISSLTGTITAVVSGEPAPAATPAPEPSASPVPTAEPTPTPEPSGILGQLSHTWIAIFGMFGIGEATGAAILLLAGRFWK